MKKLILITAIGILAHINTTHAQDNTQQKQPKDNNKTEMQQDDMKKSRKKDSTGKMDKKKKEDGQHKMEHYPSNKQGDTDPKEQRHMDSTINNHR